MSRGDSDPVATQQTRSAQWGLALWRRLLVTVGLRADPAQEEIRRNTLAALVAIFFALGGAARHFDWSAKLADSPFELDMAYRAVANGWFESDATVPVTLVDIDAATYRDWGMPPFTPREHLSRLLEAVTRADPAAVVVDIDLSWGDLSPDSADAGAQRLRQFLEHYRGAATLVFPKRIEKSGADENHWVTGPLDDVFAANEHLAWAHASVETDGGAVRSWPDWLPVCTAAGREWMPSIAVRVLTSMRHAAFESASVRDAPSTCVSSADPEAQVQRLLIGPGLTAKSSSVTRSDARVIPASLVLDPDMARDDAWLFGGRVVFIGATHPGAGDFWLTPSGVRPGVEMLANAVRYAPVQRTDHTTAQRLGYRGLSLLLFAMFIYFERKLRGPLAYVATAAFVLATVAVVMAAVRDLAVFDALEAAILLVVLYKALDVALGFVAEVRTTRARFQSGWRGWTRAAVALCRRET